MNRCKTRKIRKRSCLPSRIFSYAFSPVSTPENERGRLAREEEMSNSVRERKSVRTCGRFHSVIVLVNIN